MRRGDDGFPAEREEEMRRRLLARLELEGAPPDERIRELIDEEIVAENRRESIPLERRIPLRSALFNGLRRLDVIQELLEDESVKKAYLGE